nr:hypothetical protein [Corallococcus macrosporus]
MPELDAVRREYEPKGVGFLALSLNPSEERTVREAARLGLGMTLAIAQGEVLGPLHVSTVPATVYIDRHGVVVAAISGERDRAFHTRRVKALLAGSP